MNINNAERPCRGEEMQTDGYGADGGPARTRVPLHSSSADESTSCTGQSSSPAFPAAVSGPKRVAPGLCAPIPDYHEDSKELHPSPEFSYRSGYPSGRASYQYPPEGGCLPYDRHRLYGHRVLLHESREGQAKRLSREINYRAKNNEALKRIANAGSAAIERRGGADHAVMCRCGPASSMRSQHASNSPASAASSGSPPRSDSDERHVAVAGTPAAAAAPGWAPAEERGSTRNGRGGTADPYASFEESAKARDILRYDLDGEFRRAVQEAVELDYPPARLRDIFSIFCAFNKPTDAALVWRDYKTHLAADYTLILDGDERAAQAAVLTGVSRMLSNNGLSLSSVGLPATAELVEDHDQH